jgi:pyruvate,water dikinase
MTATFEPPGPGGWMQLRDHFPGALTLEVQRLFAAAQTAGSASYMAAYGVLARNLEVAFVHGHLYIAPVPLAGPREMKRTPPAAAVWLVSRLHPAFRRRTRAAGRALADRPWRAVAQRWKDEERAGWAERAQRLQDEDPAGLDEAALADHLRRVRALAADGLARHFELHGDDLLPIGLLLARCIEWGVPPATAMAALDGASPGSAGTVLPPDWQLVTGYDLDSFAWCELGATRPPGVASASEAIDLLPLVPAEARDELTGLVDDARNAVALRDDNGVVIAAWPMGLLRRAMLEAGRRLGLSVPAHAVELTVDELTALLDGTTAPDGLTRASAPEVAAGRLRLRREQSALDAPPTLGPEFAIPPLAPLPRPLALIGAAQIAAAEHMTGSDDEAVGVGAAVHTGRALVVDDPNEALELIEPGDVLITKATSPSWNVVIAHAGALVTTAGGLLSHAAIIARELGIPAVIGAPGSAHQIETGTTVVVDPVAATLTVVTDAAT